MKVGDRVSELVSFGDTTPLRKTGTVVYIHPERRFYVAEFEFEKGRLRESYLFPGLGRTEADEKYRPQGGRPGSK